MRNESPEQRKRGKARGGKGKFEEISRRFNSDLGDDRKSLGRVLN